MLHQLYTGKITIYLGIQQPISVESQTFCLSGLEKTNRHSDDDGIRSMDSSFHFDQVFELGPRSILTRGMTIYQILSAHNLD